MKRGFGKMFSAVKILFLSVPLLLGTPNLSLLLPLQLCNTQDLSSTCDTAGDWKYF